MGPRTREGEPRSAGIRFAPPPAGTAEGGPCTIAQAQALYDAPFCDLLFTAQSVHRRYFDPNQVQLSRLLSIKTGGCPENCGYCSQSVHHQSGLESSSLMDVEQVIAEARQARDGGRRDIAWGPRGAAPRRATWNGSRP